MFLVIFKHKMPLEANFYVCLQRVHFASQYAKILKIFENCIYSLPALRVFRADIRLTISHALYIYSRWYSDPGVHRPNIWFLQKNILFLENLSPILKNVYYNY